MNDAPIIKINSTPKLSVIIPTYNRAEILKQCLQAINEQHLSPGDCEILVVDDGSEDHTLKVVENFNSKFKIKYLLQANKGPSAARNLGIKQAVGKIILILNDDAIVGENLLRNHLKMHEKFSGQEKLAVLGTREFTVNDRLKALNFLYDEVPFSMRVFGLREGFYGLAYFVTFNISLRRKDFWECGGFDEDFTSAIGEDTEFGIRWNKQLGKIFFSPQLKAFHKHDTTLYSLKSQMIRETYNTLIIYSKHPDLPQQNNLFNNSLTAKQEFVSNLSTEMQRFESIIKELEKYSIWDIEGQEFMGLQIDSITNLVVAVRKLVPRFRAYIALKHYLENSEVRIFQEKWSKVLVAMSYSG